MCCLQAVQGQYLDTEGFDALGFRVRGDGRMYIASLRTDNWIVGSNSHDVWQAFLFARCACTTQTNSPRDLAHDSCPFPKCMPRLAYQACGNTCLNRL